MIFSLNSGEKKNRLKRENPEEYLKIIRKENEEIRKTKQKLGKLGGGLKEEPETIGEIEEPKTTKNYSIAYLAVFGCLIIALASFIIVAPKEGISINNDLSATVEEDISINNDLSATVDSHEIDPIESSRETNSTNIIMPLIVVGIIIIILVRRFSAKCPKCQQYRSYYCVETKQISEKQPFYKTITRTDIRKNSKGEEIDRTYRKEQVHMIKYKNRYYYESRNVDIGAIKINGLKKRAKWNTPPLHITRLSN
jgi:hypothetical protein